MIFVVDENNLSILESPGFIKCVEKLCESHNKGKHMIILDLAIARGIMRSKKYKPFCKNVARWNISRASFLDTYLNKVNIYIEVSNLTGNPRLRVENEVRVIVMPYRQIQSRELYLRTEVIGEYLYDCDLFEKMGRDFIERNSLSNSRISMDKVSGGGSTTADVYHRKQAASQRLCMAVTDSDKLHPNDVEKGTASKLNSKNKASLVYSDIVVLPLHEIENFIPALVIEKSFIGTRKQRHISSICRIIDIIQKSNSPLSIYLDIKGGIKNYDMNQYRGNNPNLFLFIDQELKGVGIISEAEDYSCKNPANCSSKKNCECWVIPPTKNVMSFVMDYIGRNNGSLQSVNKSIDVIELLLAKEIFSWCVAYRKLASQ